MKGNWSTVTLGELTADTRPICYGVLKPGPNVDGGIPLIRITDLANGHVDNAGLHRISARLDAEFSRSRLRGGEVLISIQGTIGRLAVCPPELAGANISRTIARIDPDERVDRRYLFHYLGTQIGRFHTAGSTRASLNIRTLRQLEIPLPPIEEQRRIAVVLDSADALRAWRREALAKLETLTQAIFVDKFGDLDAYDRRPFGELLIRSPRNGISPSKAGTVSGSVITLSAITGRRFDAGKQKESSFAAPHDEEKTVDVRDFLICRGNGNLALVGRAKFPDHTLGDVAFPDTMIAARPDPRWIGREFLAHVWTLDVVRRQIEAGARTTNGTHKVNQGTIAAIEVPVPPLEGQAQFADAVKAVACAAVAQEVSRMHFDDLFASLQQRAFRGEL